MKRESFINAMLTHNDAYINYNSKISKKIKYYIGTLDFFNTKYVRDLYVEKYKKNPPTLKQTRESTGENILVFCWDLNDFKNIDVQSIVSVDGLSSTLKNG